MNNGALCKEYFNVILQTKSFDKGQICLPDAFGEICVKILGFKSPSIVMAVSFL